MGEFESTGGRKAKALAAVRGSRFAMGLDITRNHISLVAADLSGRIQRHIRIPKTFARSPAYGEFLAGLISRYRTEWRIPVDRFLGVGISVPGIIDAQGRMIQDSHALGVRKMPCDELSKGIEYPCVFMNDANAAGFAELRESSDMENAVYLSLSNSVGGAFLQEAASIWANIKEAANLAI